MLSMSDKPESSQGQPYTASSLAAAAGVIGAYVSRLCREGKLVCTKLNPQVWLIAYEDGQRWLHERQARIAQES